MSAGFRVYRAHQSFCVRALSDFECRLSTTRTRIMVPVSLRPWSGIGSGGLNLRFKILGLGFRGLGFGGFGFTLNYQTLLFCRFVL